jgi:hypothetical protein
MHVTNLFDSQFHPKLARALSTCPEPPRYVPLPCPPLADIRPFHLCTLRQHLQALHPEWPILDVEYNVEVSTRCQRGTQL